MSSPFLGFILRAASFCTERSPRFGLFLFGLHLELVFALRRVLEEPEFKGKFAALVFAIMEGRVSARKPVEENGKFAPFYEIFGRWE